MRPHRPHARVLGGLAVVGLATAACGGHLTPSTRNDARSTPSPNAVRTAAGGWLGTGGTRAPIPSAGARADRAHDLPWSSTGSSAGAKASAAASPSPGGVYAATGAGLFNPTVSADPPLVYVPNSGETGMHGTHPSRSPDRDTVTVIDPRTFKIVGHFPAGRLPQHVTPSWDLTTLWVDASGSNQLIPVDPHTGRPGAPVTVQAPYNLYFTPDGRSALIMAERLNRIDVRDPHTMALRRSVAAPCEGINHADFSADGAYLIATCEFSGQLLKFDSTTLALLGTLDLGRTTMPQDIRLGPDGRTFLVASLNEGGLITVDGADLRRTGAIRTGAGAHGIYPSRDGKQLYVSNRDAGSVTVVDPTSHAATATWPIPGGGSPDMGSVSADGSQLWLSGRDNDEVYVFSTTDGHLLARIPVGANPHGLTFFPQPGRYSLGHTGNFR